MFYHEPEASRVALSILLISVGLKGFHFIDCQQETPHMERLGGRPVPRKEFLKLLKKSGQARTIQGTWAVAE